MARRYRLKARAQRQDNNRRRIVEAAYQLHMTIGASRATASVIRQAGGTEAAYRTAPLPDLVSLFTACTLHGMELDPRPTRLRGWP